MYVYIYIYIYMYVYISSCPAGQHPPLLWIGIQAVRSKLPNQQITKPTYQQTNKQPSKTTIQSTSQLSNQSNLVVPKLSPSWP